ncbi:MAG: thioesterase family protein [Acidimicrobiia bacterium]|nr:thioesterase family protein [Acidimicrobiia bacterium]MDH5503194.1 thioesterase family protein [Acidimicrobiia bacterium]
MKASLRPGLTHQLTERVSAELSPPHLLPLIVLSTPSMILLMEMASLYAAQPHLDENETTVGTHVDVSHGAAAREGETVIVDSELVAMDRRRLTFAVRVSVGDRIVGEGTHQRAVIDKKGFGP